MGNHLKAQTVFDRYDRIRMDSSTLMNHRELQLFMQQYGDRLRSSGKQIFILETVRLEIIRHLGGTDTDKSEKAMACMAVLNEYSDLFVYEGGALPEELVDDAFADPEILAAMTRDKRRYRQLLIASDRGLSMDAVNLNRQYSCHGEPVSVKKIAKSGKLKSFNEKRYLASADRKSGKHVHDTARAAEKLQVASPKSAGILEFQSPVPEDISAAVMDHMPEPAAGTASATSGIPRTAEPPVVTAPATADRTESPSRSTGMSDLLWLFGAAAAGFFGVFIGAAAISLPQT